MLVATLDLVPDSSAGTVTEENGTTVITVAESAVVNVTAEITDADIGVQGYQLNFSNSASELGIGNYSLGSSLYNFGVDEVLDSSANDYFVSSGRLQDLDVPPTRLFGTFDVTAPSTPGDYLVTSNFISGNELNDTIISNSSGATLNITDFGDLIIRVAGASTPEATLDLVPDSSAGTVSEENGTTVITVAQSAVVNVTAEITNADIGVQGYQLNFSNSASELGIGNYSLGSSQYNFGVDEVLDSSANDYFVSSGRLQDLDIPPTQLFGTFDVTAPSAPGDYLVTSNFITGNELNDTIISNSSGATLDIANFGDLIIRVTGPSTPEATLDLVPDSSAGTVSEENGTTVITVTESTVVNVTAEITNADIGVQGYQLNFSNSASELGIGNYSIGGSQYNFGVDEVLDSSANDYFVSSGRLQDLDIPPTQLFGTFDVTAPSTPGDYRVTSNFITGNELNDTIVSNSSGATLDIANFGDLIIRVEAAPLPTVTLAAPSAASIAEGDSPNTVTMAVNLSEASDSDVTVPFTLTGTAADGSDYTITASPITITAGMTTADITVTVTDDSEIELDETVIVTLGTPTNADLGATTAQTVTITDNDVPTVTLAAPSTASITEGDSPNTVTIAVELSEQSPAAITVPFTLTGTATDGSDYTITTSPITIDAGTTTADITITITDDTEVEVDETVIVTLGTPTNADLGATTEQTVTIVSDDIALPTVTLGAPSVASIAEGDSPNTVTISVDLSEASGSDVTVPFTLSGTAADGSDYTITTSPVTISSGTTSADITVTITDDSEIEASETVVVTLGTPTGADLGTTTEQTVTITDNDVPTVTLDAPSAASITEGDSPNTVTIAVTLSEAAATQVSVPFTLSGTATDGSDFSITTSPITIDAGVTTADITITVTDDGDVEPDETVIVTLGTPTGADLGATTEQTVTIVSDDVDPPTVTLGAPSASSITEGDSPNTVTMSVNLSEASGSDVTVPFTLTGTAADGSDYTITTSPVTISAGATSADITITVTDDSIVESDESVIVTLGTPTGADLGSTIAQAVTIVDNDLPTVSFSTTSGSVSEDSTSPLLLTVNLSDAVSSTVTVDFVLSGTADGSDYTINPANQVSFAPGATSATITIDPFDDGRAEADESVIVELTSATGAVLGGNTTFTGTILDTGDDQDEVRIIVPEFVVRPHVIPGDSIPTAIIFEAVVDTVVTVAKIGSTSPNEQVEIIDETLSEVGGSVLGIYRASLSAGENYAVIFEARDDAATYVIRSSEGPSSLVGSGNNLFDIADVNADGETSALDALLVINQLASQQQLAEGEEKGEGEYRLLDPRFTDVNRDGKKSTLDALWVINRLSEQNAIAEAEQVSIQQILPNSQASDDDSNQDQPQLGLGGDEQQGIAVAMVAAENDSQSQIVLGADADTDSDFDIDGVDQLFADDAFSAIA